MKSDAESLARVAGQKVSAYQLILPPGWKQYPVRPGLATILFEHIRVNLERPETDQVLGEMRSLAQRSMKELIAHGGIDLFLPERTRAGSGVPASLTSSLVQIGGRGVEVALRHLTHGRETEKVEVHSGTAYRWRTVTKGKDELAGLESSNVFFLFPLPGERSTRAILFTFAVIKSDELPPEYTEVLELIFEAMMQSLVWISDEDD